MATDKRERQRANRALKQEQQEQQDKQQETRQRVTTGLIAFAVVVLLGGLFYFFTRDDDSTETETTSEETTDSSTDGDDDTTSSTVDPNASAVSVPEPGGTIDGTTECPAEDGSSERITSFAEAPPTCIDEAKTYTAVLDTTLGEITIELDPAEAPETVNNFVVLSRYHYYDGAPFHRIIPGFVIQGGDAVGPTLGVGNPGYAIPDELPDEGEYEVGSVAMANSGPDTSGSQFFIITGDQGAALPPQYSLFGTVTEGMDVVEAIESIPTTPTDAPTEEIYIISSTISES